MDVQVEKLLAGVGNTTFETVARGVLDDDSATLNSKPVFEEITTSHADLRTIGIVKISGTAQSASDPNGKSTERAWSTVVKIIDPKKEARRAILDNEAQVYKLGLFSGDEAPFRAAKCYFIGSHENDLSTLWLEDLSTAPQPPWNLEQFTAAANHIGQFNGHHLKHDTKLPIDVLNDSYITRLDRHDRSSIADELVEKRDTDAVKSAYAESSIESTIHLFELADRLIDAGQQIEHGLAFGDAHSRNLFPVDGQTIGIDWGTVGMEPVGSDIGVLLGSPLSYGIQEASLAIQNERAMYDSYVVGLRSRGWDGDDDELRLGFFCQFAFYIELLGGLPVAISKIVSDHPERIEFIEKRFGVRFDDLPAHLAPVLAAIPRYTEELDALLG
jgi:hypothetical protein